MALGLCPVKRTGHTLSTALAEGDGRLFELKTGFDQAAERVFITAEPDLLLWVRGRDGKILATGPARNSGMFIESAPNAKGLHR